MFRLTFKSVFGGVALLLLLASFFTAYLVQSSRAYAAANTSQTINMFVTSYGFNDNSPPSAIIAFPKSDGNPTLHNLATEGKGTVSDPITFATDPKEFKPGTRVYVPFLRKYFIMEDECVACESDFANHKFHIDLWMGPQHSSTASVLFACEDSITRDSTPVIVNPATNLAVDTTPLFSNNKCTAHIH